METRFHVRIRVIARPSSYPLELRRRAVRMVEEVLGDYPTVSAALKAVAQKLGIGGSAGRSQGRRRSSAEGRARRSWVWAAMPGPQVGVCTNERPCLTFGGDGAS